MIEPRKGTMNYEKLEELAYYYMFVSSCLTEEDESKLKEEWKKQGGHKEIPWWKFVMENTKVGLDLK